MAPKSGRRDFLKSVTATAALSATACGEQDGVKSAQTPVGSNGQSSATTDTGTHTGETQSSTGEATVSASTNPNTTTPNVDPQGSTSEPTVSPSGSTTSRPTQTSASSTTTADSSSPTSDTTVRPTGPLGVALLGLGKYASERLAPALQLTQHCRLVGIITGTPSKVADWQSSYGIEDKNVYDYETMDALIDNPDIHVVYVVTPNHVHPEFVMRAARAKKHVWCEKPLAMTVEECEMMIGVCQQNGVSLSVGYRLQHEPNTQTFRSYAESKPFGAITKVEALAGFYGYGPNDAQVWRLKKAPGGGALYDMGVYCINGARFALQQEPIRVRSAKQWTDRPELFSEVDEFTDFELEFPGGVVAACRTSFGERMDVIKVTCETGDYSLEPFQAYTGVGGQASDGTQFKQPIENQQAKQMDDDALAIIEGRPPQVPGEEGLRDVRIVRAIFQAAETQQPVDLG